MDDHYFYTTQEEESLLDILNQVRERFQIYHEVWPSLAQSREYSPEQVESTFLHFRSTEILSFTHPELMLAEVLFTSIKHGWNFGLTEADAVFEQYIANYKKKRINEYILSQEKFYQFMTTKFPEFSSIRENRLASQEEKSAQLIKEATFERLCQHRCVPFYYLQRDKKQAYIFTFYCVSLYEDPRAEKIRPTRKEMEEAPFFDLTILRENQMDLSFSRILFPITTEEFVKRRVELEEIWRD